MSITQLPTPPSRQDPLTFAQRADSFLSALPQFVGELNTTASSLESKQALNSGYATTTAANLITSNTLLNSAQTESFNLEKVYIGSTTATPTQYSDSTSLQNGALFWKSNELVFKYYWNGTWTPLAYKNNATTALNNIQTASTYYTQIQEDRNNLQLLKSSVDERYMGEGTVGNEPNPGSQLVGSLYWNTDTNRFYVWTGSAWQDFLNAGYFSSNGGSLSGDLTASYVNTDYYTVGEAIGALTTSTNRQVTVGSISNVLHGGIVDMGVLDDSTIGYQDLDFRDSTTVIGALGGTTTVVTCNNPIPAGCCATLVINYGSGSGSRSISFGSGFRKASLNSVALTGPTKKAIFYFVSDG